MNKGIMGVVAVAVLIAGYFGAQSMGLIGGAKALSDDEIAAGLSAYADQINAEGGLRFDDFSELSSATAVEKQITIRGDTFLSMADVGEDYIDSREAQAQNKICSDEALRPLLENRATFMFNWFSSDNERIGGVTLRGESICADGGY